MDTRKHSFSTSMAFTTFIRDIRSSAGVHFSQEEIANSTHLVSSTCSTPTTKPKSTLHTTNTSQIISARQSHYGVPWGVNIPPYRQLATGPSSSLPESSISSVLLTRSSHRPLIHSGLDIQSNQRRLVGPSDPIALHGPPQLKNGTQHTHPTRKDDSCQEVGSADNFKSFHVSTALASQPLDFTSGHPESFTPAEFIAPASGVLIGAPDTDTPSNPFFSLPVGFPQLPMGHSSSADSDHGPTSFSANHLCTPSSPRTTSSPLTCKTCRFPFQRTSSESSFLLKLSQRSPLFDDLDQDDASHLSDPSPPDTPSIGDRHRCGSQSSLSSSSPEAFHSLSSWWSDIPPHRQAHIIEAESWPIFTPNVPSLGNDSPSGERCACVEPVPQDSSTKVPDAVGMEQIRHPQESPHSSSPPTLGNLQSRPSISTNLNLLVPIPLDHNEIDPLLLTTSSIGESTPAPPKDVVDFDSPHLSITREALRRKKRKEECVPKSSESLLTKSLRRLSRKLPNIQWGNLSIRMQNSALDGKSATTGEEDQHEEGDLPSGVVDEDSSVGLAYEDEKAQISRLVKSWTLDNIQPQNSMDGSFINDPEMEWSSMVVQLETFSPRSSKKLRSNVRIHAEKNTPRNSRAHQYSKKSGTTIMASPTCRSHERRGSDERCDTHHEKPNQVKKTQAKRNSRSTRNQPLQANNEIKKNAVKITKRVVSNPLHLLQLTLELEMMRKMKINSPLKQRSMKIIIIKRGPGSQSFNNTNEFDYVGSPLRFEVL